jgi:hypothetical protein
MAEIQGGLEGQLGFLTEQVEFLRDKVDELSARLQLLESGKPAVQQASTVKAETASAPIEAAAVPKEGVFQKAGTGTLLPRVATVCFIMVVALILRTITDNGAIDTQLGSILGMGYAAALILVGGWFYLKKSSLAPVFPACGLLLLFSIVIETHTRFQSLSTVWAYVILIITGAVVTAMGLRHRAPFQLYSAALGSGLIGMTIDFPYPVYPLLAVIIFGSCFAGYIAYRQKICPTLRWTSAGLMIIFMLFWVYKLNGPQPTACDDPSEDSMFLTWFFPLVFVFWAFYLVTNLRRMVTDKEELGFFESLLPTVTGVGAYLAAWSVMVAWYINPLILGILGIAVGLLHLWIGAWMAKRNKEGAIGSTPYIFPAVLLLSLGVATITSNPLWAVPVLSVLAYIMTRIASKWESGGIRCVSYIFQSAAVLVAMATGIVAVDTPSPMIGSLLLGILMVMSFLQYRWARTHAPPSMHSAFFSWLDKKDFSAAVLLLASVVSTFFLIRLGLYQVLIRSTTELEFMFRGGQTFVLNSGAVFLLLIASSKRNKEILTIAIVVGILGMFKSFVFDLFGIKGIPLVLSIFSSGVVAAVGSVVSTRWHGHKQKVGQKGMAVSMES